MKSSRIAVVGVIFIGLIGLCSTPLIAQTMK